MRAAVAVEVGGVGGGRGGDLCRWHDDYCCSVSDLRGLFGTSSWMLL